MNWNRANVYYIGFVTKPMRQGRMGIWVISNSTMKNDSVMKFGEQGVELW